MRAQLERDFERFGRAMPGDLAGYVRQTYRIDLSARYLGYPIPHPVGKGSGQLSLSLEQLEGDRVAGLAFTVLKTVIGQDPRGRRRMEAWAVRESRMRVERRRSAGGQEGWTVTWKGRGWDRPFEEYLALVRAAGDLTRSGGLLAVPSVKLHLPRLDQPFDREEYAYTIGALAAAWGGETLALEKDFSPTLAGDPLADERERVLRWLREVPGRIREAAAPHPMRLALKLMNARHDDEFQLAMLQAAGGADTLVVFNRMWSAEQGVAYGGYDLSDRNLRVLAAARARRIRTPPLSGTGNVCTGRLLIEYARRGCESVQIHTFLQLPLGEYPASAGARAERALHALYFHPETGVIAGLLDLEAAGELHRHDGELRFRDLPAAGGAEP